jgi:tRNA-binding EMAP/Myf-like protein
LGCSTRNQAEIQQWLSFCSKYPSFSIDQAKVVDEFLLGKTYLVGNSLTVADISLYCSVVNSIDWVQTTLNQLKRWFEHVQTLGIPKRHVAFPRIPTYLPTTLFVWAAASTSCDATSALPASNATTTPTSSSNDAASKTVAESKERGSNVKIAEASAIEPDAGPLDPSKLDIRCGVIVRCWDHPGSDKLLCEEIDLGESSLRTIASGLRLHYTANEMTGKKVLVMANLKERTMAGFKSQVFL